MISSGPLEDRLMIRELVESYNDAVMRFDGDAWAANWTDDATWVLAGMGEFTGKANFYPVWQGAMSGFSAPGSPRPVPEMMTEPCGGVSLS